MKVKMEVQYNNKNTVTSDIEKQVKEDLKAQGIKMNAISVLASSSGQASTTQSIISMVVIYAAIIGIFWFFAIRPQKKQQKEHDTLLTTLEVGDSVLTTSGFFGVVIDIMDEVVIVEFGNNKNCRIPMKKENIVEIDKQGNESK